MSIGNVNVSRLVPGLIEPAKSGSITEQSGDVKSGEFKELFSNLINSVNEAGMESKEIQDAFLSGDPVELHQMMIKAEQAGLSMDLLLEVRNKLLATYTEIMRMPI